MMGASSPPVSSSSISNASYPQLNNLYPAPTSATSPTPPSQSQPASGNPNQSTKPTTGPGSGFPARPPQPAPSHPHTHGHQHQGINSGAYGAAPVGMGMGMGGMRMGGAGMAPGSGSGQRGGLPVEEKNVAQLIVDTGNKYQRAYRHILDRSSPLPTQRWLFTGAIVLVFIGVVVIRQGWYIVCYALAIYLLNLFLAFLQPRFDPAVQADLAQEDVEEGAPGLPGASTGGGGGGSNGGPGGLKGLLSGFGGQGDDEEFRPFIRRLPEFKFWLSATKASFLALVSTITRATDVPVYWPILVVYFLVLMSLTLRRQIQHMIKYKYIPFDLGRKATYGKK